MIDLANVPRSVCRIEKPPICCKHDGNFLVGILKMELSSFSLMGDEGDERGMREKDPKL